MTWTFPSGARIILGHCQEENDVHRYDSTEINLFTPDEITSFTEFQYLYIGFERVRSSDPNLPAIIRCCGMPGNIGHTWVKKRFVKPYPEGGRIIIGRGGNKRFYIHSTQLDNPGIDPGYKQSLEALPEAERKAKLLGDWDAYQGSVFDEFRDRNYPSEPGNALHVIEPFEVPSWWPRVVVGDWGYAAMTWIGFAAIAPTKRVYIYRELHWIKTKIAEWAPILKEYIDKEKPRLIRFCKSAGQDRGQENTIQEQISSALGVGVELSDNKPGSRVTGKMLIHEYLRWRAKKLPPVEDRPVYNEEYAMRIYRMQGEDDYKRYMNLFIPPEPETNIPKLQIFKTCPTLIDTIKACSYDQKKIEDVAEFPGDDPYDGLRYLLDGVSSFFSIAEREFEKVQQQEEIVNRFNATKDWTAFYRNMKKIESVGVIKPVARYRH
jgi:hypothetical protein